MSVTLFSAKSSTSLEAHEHAHDVHDTPAIQGERSRAQHPRRAKAPSVAIVPPLLLALALLVGWYAITAYGHINSLLLPAPADVLSSLADGIQSGLYWSNALITMQESVCGFLLAVVIALPLGYGIAKSRLLAGTLQPYLAAGQGIPTIVLAPFLFLWLGTGVLPVIVACMLIVLFPMVMNTILGMQTIERALLDAARVEGASGWTLLAYIEFPLALPAILAAVRTALTLSITGAIVGEFICSPDQGLGALVQIALHQYNMPLMFATVLLLGLLAALYYIGSWLLMKLAALYY